MSCRGRGGTSTEKKGNDTGRRRKNHLQHHHTIQEEWEIRVYMRGNTFWWVMVLFKFVHSSTSHPLQPYPHPMPRRITGPVVTITGTTQNEASQTPALPPWQLWECPKPGTEGRGQNKKHPCSEAGKTLGKRTRSIRRSVGSTAASKLFSIPRATAICYHE